VRESASCGLLTHLQLAVLLDVNAQTCVSKLLRLELGAPRLEQHLQRRALCSARRTQGTGCCSFCRTSRSVMRSSQACTMSSMRASGTQTFPRASCWLMQCNDLGIKPGLD